MQRIKGEEGVIAAASPCVDSTSVILSTVCMPNASLTGTQFRQVPCNLSQEDLRNPFCAEYFFSRKTAEICFPSVGFFFFFNE